MAYLTGLRWQEAFRQDKAIVSFADAATASWAADDTLSTIVALLAQARSEMIHGRLTEMAETAARTDSLAIAYGNSRILPLKTMVSRAGAANQAGRLDEADRLYGQALTAAEGHRAYGIIFAALNGLGATHSRRRQLEDSIAYYQRALAVAQALGDPMRQCMVLANMGYDETTAWRLDSARDHLDQALRLAEACHLLPLLAHIRSGQGALAETEGDRDQAIAFFETSNQLYLDLNDEGGELGSRQRLAYNLLVQGHYGRARRNYERCLEILEHRDSLVILNWVLMGLAMSQHRLGYLDDAEVYYERARRANAQLGDQSGVAWCLHAMGMIHSLRGDYRQALVKDHEARALYEEIDDREGVGTTMLGLAEVYYLLGDWDRAFDHYQQAADIARDNNLEQLLQGAVSGLTTVSSAAGRPEVALEHCRQALALARKWSDATSIIWALTDLAELKLKTGEPAAAVADLYEAESLLGQEGEYLLQSRTHQLLARCAYDDGRTAEAVVQATVALTAATAGCLPEREWSCLSDLGRYQQAAGDLGAARSSQRAAIQVAESLRRNVGVDELRRHMLRPALTPYERLIALLLEGESRGESQNEATGTVTGEAARAALTCAERSRARVLAARLRTTDVTDEADTDSDVRRRQREVRSRIGYLQAKLQNPDLSPEQRRTWREEVDELEQAYGVLRLQTPESATPVPSTDPEIESAWSAALADGEQALSYFLGDEHSYLFHVHAGRVTAHRLPARAVIEDKVQLYLHLRNQADHAVLPAEVVVNAGRTLYDLLLGPVRDDLTGCSALVIVPDGILHHLSLATLPGPDTYLVEHCPVSYAPSLGSLRHLRQRQQKRLDRPERPTSVVAVGFGGGDEDTPEAQRRINPFNDEPVATLPHAASEAWDVANLFERVTVLTGSAASEQAVKNLPLAEVDVLHVAAHGYAADRDVRRSFILLAAPDQAAATAAADSLGRQPAPATTEDGLLQWQEVASLDLGASLVTLSSCRSAGGVLAVGEGITGLTQAFLHAGGSCVLAAQADVPDTHARRFMLAFYRRLREGMTAAGALRDVQLATLTEARRSGGTTPDPHWDDFVIIGDGAVRLSGRAAPSLRRRFSSLGGIILGGTLVMVLGAWAFQRVRRT